MAGKTEPLITAADVAELRQLSESSMDCTCDIHRPSEATAGAGGTIRRNLPGALIASAVPCRFAIISAGERQRAGELAADGQWTVVLPVGTDARLGDHLTVHGTSRALAAGAWVDQPFAQPMRVSGVPSPRSYQALLKVFAAPLAPSES
jgi:hypothetical protein